MSHELHIIGKTRIEATEVKGVESFDEESICMNLQDEDLILYGKNMHIETLDLDTGILIASGEIESAAYARKIKRKPLLERIRK